MDINTDKSIRSLYPSVVTIVADGDEVKCSDAQGVNVPIDMAAANAEAAQLNADEAANKYKEDRSAAYQAEADPLFFEEQRGEVPAGTHAAKVAEIKARFPK